MSSAMLSSSRLTAPFYMLAAAAFWGGMFPVAKAMLQFVDPFFLTLIRYALTFIVMLVILWAVEGGSSLRADGRRWSLLLYGCIGFCGFGFLVFSGLRASTPAHGAILVALMPMITAVITSLTSRKLPGATTLASIAVALLGVALVVSNGRPAALLESRSLGADAMILLGVASWVVYTLGGKRFAGWSPLRYSTLTVAYGLVGIATCTALADAAGLAHVPSAAQVANAAPYFIYVVVFATVIAVLAWNEGVRRMGAVNGALFINFVPITAFIIQALQGRPLHTVELAGAALVTCALLLNNLLQRRPNLRAVEVAVAKVSPMRASTLVPFDVDAIAPEDPQKTGSNAARRTPSARYC
jgi:drug/metabolite transporter (DMT)-like permease